MKASEADKRKQYLANMGDDDFKDFVERTTTDKPKMSSALREKRKDASQQKAQEKETKKSIAKDRDDAIAYIGEAKFGKGEKGTATKRDLEAYNVFKSILPEKASNYFRTEEEQEVDTILSSPVKDADDLPPSEPKPESEEEPESFGDAMQNIDNEASASDEADGTVQVASSKSKAEAKKLAMQQMKDKRNRQHKVQALALSTKRKSESQSTTDGER